MRTFYVYILGSRSGVLYTGVTNDLERRVWEHKQKVLPSFTAKYNCNRLVYYESFPDSWSAIEAEKRIKGWRREKKIRLIESQNRTWRDLSDGWYGDEAQHKCHPESSRAAYRTPATDETRCHSDGSGSDQRNPGQESGAGHPARDSSSLRSSE